MMMLNILLWSKFMVAIKENQESSFRQQKQGRMMKPAAKRSRKLVPASSKYNTSDIFKFRLVFFS